jgi:hypothetical protein
MSRSLASRLSRIEAQLDARRPETPHTPPLVLYDRETDITALVAWATCCPCHQVQVVLPRKETR